MNNEISQVAKRSKIIFEIVVHKRVGSLYSVIQTDAHHHACFHDVIFYLLKIIFLKLCETSTMPMPRTMNVAKSDQDGV